MNTVTRGPFISGHAPHRVHCLTNTQRRASSSAARVYLPSNTPRCKSTRRE
ncbi:hypothetical protein HanRHA438_Chr12g0556951 [Helianthus annuus]|uniref:Uncharacterized protein n=1 Tax=Helianthus annuus TaxID=4232 RepID=A0A9K3HHG3_HELAN|nr:hypothetical protein HanXRQr2_Chr12g0545611 [Helianthus annuus]KAJ0866893.1 hypothetical protein HanRHA438_Chr12g0556951 [Helianthus annuus]